MDSFARFLKKRKVEHDQDKKKIGKGSKYVRRSEYSKLKEAKYDEEHAKMRKARQAAAKLLADKSKAEADKKLGKLFSPRSRERLERTGNDGKNTFANGTAEAVAPKKDKEKLLPVKEVMRRLRKYGEPITLFGEDPKTRQVRLRKYEADEVGRLNDNDLALQDGHQGRNVFLDHTYSRNPADDESEDEDEKAAAQTGNAVSSPRAAQKGEKGAKQKRKWEELTDEMKCYKFWKRLLREWAAVLSQRSDDLKRSVKGKLATKTQKQCKDYMRSFFKICKKRQIPKSILDHTVKIVEFSLQREYVKAHAVYMDLAIGRAPWPIGATSVGIHARAARERIETSKIAHVMNDENARKYVTSFKRLLTFCQTQYPTDPSKMVLH